MSINYYLLVNRKMPWGGYGNILFTGLLHATRPDEDPVKYAKTHPITRSGPYIPELYRCNSTNLVVRDDIKDLFIQSGMTGVEDWFDAPIEKLVNLDWQSWNMAVDNPKIKPSNHEPYNYFGRRKHSEKLMTQVTNRYFSAIIKEGNYELDYRGSNKFGKIDLTQMYLLDEPHLDISIPSNKLYIVVSERLKKFFEDNTDNCVEFILLNRF